MRHVCLILLLAGCHPNDPTDRELLEVAPAYFGAYSYQQRDENDVITERDTGEMLVEAQTVGVRIDFSFPSLPACDVWVEVGERDVPAQTCPADDVEAGARADITGDWRLNGSELHLLVLFDIKQGGVSVAGRSIVFDGTAVRPTVDPNPDPDPVRSCRVYDDCAEDEECRERECTEHWACDANVETNAGSFGGQWECGLTVYTGECVEELGTFECECIEDGFTESMFAIDEKFDDVHRIFNEECRWLVPAAR